MRASGGLSRSFRTSLGWSALIAAGRVAQDAFAAGSGDLGQGRCESVAAMAAAHQRRIVRAGFEGTIMRTDTSEPSLHEIESTEINLEQLEAVSGGLLATTLSNLADMRHEMLKTVANNLRA